MRTVGSKVTSRSWIWDFLWYQTCPDHSEKLTDLGRKVCRRCWMKLKSDWTLPPKDRISSRNTQCSVFTNSWEFSGSPVLRAVLSLQRAQIQSPVWDLRFHKLHAAITHTHTHTHTQKYLSNEQWLHRCIMFSPALDSGGIWFMPGRQGVQTRR